MAKFVLKHTGTKLYVARPGSKQSYTRKLENAHVFKTREEAEKNRCKYCEEVKSFEECERD